MNFLHFFTFLSSTAVSSQQSCSGWPSNVFRRLYYYFP